MDSQDNKYARYVGLCGSIIVLLILLVALINFVVDPSGLFDSPRIKGFNLLKPDALAKVRVTKPYLVDAFNPQTLIAGNSRPEMGINPVSNCWPDDSKPVYNISLPGASVRMIARYIQHSASGNNVKYLFWGLDFVDFLNSEKPINATEGWDKVDHPYDKRLRIKADRTENKEYSFNKKKDHLTLLFSLDALKDSVNTVISQTNEHTPTVLRNGFNPANEFQQIMSLEGH